MDGKKEYSIKINGVEQCTDAVKALNVQLDALEDRIDAIANKNINIKVNGSTVNNAQNIQQETRAQQQLNTAAKQTLKLHADDFKNLKAGKDQMRDFLRIAKEAAAQKAIDLGENDLNTMAGLKQQLKDIKTVMQGLNIESDKFKDFQRQANEINGKLLKIERGYGQHGRNVGNYESAADGFKKINVAVGDATRSYDNYRQAVKDLTQERFRLAQSVGREAEEYKQVDRALEQLISSYSDLEKSSACMDNMLDTMQSFTAMASIGAGFQSLFGLEDSGFNETMKKLGSLMLVLKGFETLQMQWKQREGFLGILAKGFDNADTVGKDAGEKFANGFAEALGVSKSGNMYRPTGKLGKFFEQLQNFKTKFSFGRDIDKQADKLLKLIDSLKIMTRKKEDYRFDVDRILEGSYVERNFDMLSKVYGKGGTPLNDVNEVKQAMLDELDATLRLKKTLQTIPKIVNGVIATFKVLGKVIVSALSFGFALLLPELLDFLGDFVKSLNTTKMAADRAAESMNTLNKQLETRKELLGAEYLRGGMSDEEYLKQIYEAQSSALAKQISLLQERSKVMQKNSKGFWGSILHMFNATQNTEFSGQEFTVPTTVGRGRFGMLWNEGNNLEITVNNMKELEEEWNKCNEAIKRGNDYFDEFGTTWQKWWDSTFASVKDTEEVMRGLGNVALSDIVARFGKVNEQYKNGKIDAAAYQKQIGELKKEMDDSNILSSVIANLDKYIPDEGVRAAVQNIINEIVRLDDAFNMTSQQQIHYWNQVRIDAMKEGAEKQRAQIAENERYELATVAKTEEQQQLIRAKYDRQRKDAEEKAANDRVSKAKEHNKKLIDAENELIALRIENMKDGLDKLLAQIENERRLALQKARDNGMGEEMLFQINLKYDNKILDEKRKWAFEVIRIYEDLETRIIQLNKGTFDKEQETRLNALEMRQTGDIRRYGYRTITPSTYDNTSDLEAYYDKVYSIEKEAMEEQVKIRREALDQQFALDKREEELRYKRMVSLDNGEYIQQLRAGRITQEQYDDLIEKENAAHYARMEALDKEYATNIKKNTEDGLKSTLELYDKYFGQIVDLVRRDKEKIDRTIQEPVLDKQGWGVINIKEWRTNLRDALKGYDKLKEGVLEKHKELDNALKDEQITPDDFAIRKKELDAELDGINESIKSAKTSYMSSIGDFIQSIQQYIQAASQSFNQIMQAVWDAQDADFDKQEEALNKQLELIESKLEKQKELTEKYSDSINDIEDELSEARGDRRQNLIDSLNAQIAAQRASWAQEKKIELERERIQKKQDELDRQRKKAQYERDLMQAIVNGAMAVTMAGINSWPIPAIPMMALAASTTAAQVAIMASHKPYAKGGLLQGLSHAQGGIPVGNTGIEVEGNEYVVNKRTTSQNVGLLDYINSKKKKLDINDFIDFYSKGSKVSKNVSGMRKFAEGGTIPTIMPNIDANDRIADMLRMYNERPIVVSVVDIENKAADVRTVRAIAGKGAD